VLHLGVQGRDLGADGVELLRRGLDPRVQNYLWKSWGEIYETMRRK
jgi:hypothetical protein